MKKNIGAVTALYPMPVVLVGTEVEGRINYINIAHVGIIDMNTLSLSMNKAHYSNKGIKENRTLSINMPSEDMVIEADYVGLVSGSKIDKSSVFESFYGELKGAPMIKNAPLSMECEVVDILDMPNHDVFLVRPINTYCDDDVLTDGIIDMTKVKPMLFDMPQRKYWKLGEAFADCWSVGNGYKRGFIMDYKIIEKEAFTVMGVSEVFKYDTAKSEIPKFWTEHFQTGKGEIVCGMYGVCIDEDTGTDDFEYLIADNYNPLSEVPDGYVTKIIPKNTWAVFACKGAMPDSIQDVNQKIFAEWLPNCKDYEIAAGYNIEMYTNVADYPKGTQDENYYSEIWIPVKKK